MVLEQVLGGCQTCVLGQGDPVFCEQQSEAATILGSEKSGTKQRQGERKRSLESSFKFTSNWWCLLTLERRAVRKVVFGLSSS